MAPVLAGSACVSAPGRTLAARTTLRQANSSEYLTGGEVMTQSRQIAGVDSIQCRCCSGVGQHCSFWDRASHRSRFRPEEGELVGVVLNLLVDAHSAIMAAGYAVMQQDGSPAG